MKKILFTSLVSLFALSASAVDLAAGYNTWSKTEGLKDNNNVSVVIPNASAGLFIDVDGKTISSATISSVSQNYFQVATGYTATINNLVLAGATTNTTNNSIKIGTSTEANKKNFLGTLIINMGTATTYYGFEVNSGILKLLESGQTLSNRAFTVNSNAEIHMLDRNNGTSYHTYNNGGTITANGGKFYAGRVVAPNVVIKNGGLVSASNGIRLLSNGSASTIDGQLIVAGYDNGSGTYTAEDGITYRTRHFSFRVGNGTNASADADAKVVLNIGENGSIVQTCSNSSMINDFLGQVNVNSAENSLKFQSNIVLASKGKLTLNSTNAFATINASKEIIANQANTTFYISRHYNDSGVKNGTYSSDSDLVINADNDLGALAFGSNTKLTLSIADDAVFTLGEITTQSGSNGEFTFILDNWHDNSFKIVDMALADLEKISFYEEVVDGETVSLSKLDVKFVETSLGSGDYWVNAVPEPAEWAIIFGAIALGFVAYRRRK